MDLYHRSILTIRLNIYIYIAQDQMDGELSREQTQNLENFRTCQLLSLADKDFVYLRS